MENEEKKMTLTEAVDFIKSEIEPLISEYSVEWHDLDKYRGMAFVDDAGNEINVAEFNEVNAIINNIQALFYEIYPVLDFVNSRQVFARNMVTSYNQLMKQLTDNGAEVHDVNTDIN